MTCSCPTTAGIKVKVDTVKHRGQTKLRPLQEGRELPCRTGAARQHSWGEQAAETMHATAQGRMPTGPPCTSSVYQRIPPTSITLHECGADLVPHPSGLESLTPSVGLPSSTVSIRQVRHSLECGSHGWRYRGTVCSCSLAQL